MRKICVALSKGGVGKSATSVSIAHGIALLGKRVLLVDTDDQGRDDFLLGANPTYGLADVLNEEIDVDKAIHKARDNLWILSGGSALSGIKKLIGQIDFGGEHTLSNALLPLENQFDFVVVDTSPTWDTLTINSLFYCGEVLTPVSMEVLALKGLSAFAKKLKDVQAYHPSLKHKYLVPTFLDGRVKKSREILAQLKKYYGALLCDPVQYCVRISESTAFGKTIYEFSPSSNGAKCYQKTVKRIIKDGH